MEMKPYVEVLLEKEGLAAIPKAVPVTVQLGSQKMLLWLRGLGSLTEGKRN